MSLSIEGNIETIEFNSIFDNNYYKSEFERFKGSISKLYKNNKVEFKLENQFDRGFSNNGKDYFGSFHRFEVIKDDLLIGNIDCFRSINYDFFTIYTY